MTLNLLHKHHDPIWLAEMTAWVKDSLAAAGKNLARAEHYAPLVAELKKRNVFVVAALVFGFDHDTIDVFDRTLEYLARCRFNSASLKILTPYPGTALHDTMRAAGRITDTNLDNYDEQHVVYQPRRLTAEALLAGYQRAVRQFYRLGTIARRIAANLPTLGLAPLPYLANLGWRAEYLRGLRTRAQRGSE